MSGAVRNAAEAEPDNGHPVPYLALQGCGVGVAVVVVNDVKAQDVVAIDVVIVDIANVADVVDNAHAVLAVNAVAAVHTVQGLPTVEQLDKLVVEQQTALVVRWSP